jgi:dihydroorotase
VVGIGSAPAGFEANSVLDASGCIVCPGLIDLSARLREPGFEYRATLESEMEAAVAGGVTRLACPPDTDPVLDEPGLVEMLTHRARLPEFAHVHPIGALTVQLEGKALTEMAELAEAGCVAFGQANRAVVDTQVLLRAMMYAATFDFPVWLQAQDPFLAKKGVAHDGEVAARLGLAGIPVAAETIALATMLQLARETGARVHVTRISSAAGVEMISAARAAGIAVTCDVGCTTCTCAKTTSASSMRMRASIRRLRATGDRDALRRGLASRARSTRCAPTTPRSMTMASRCPSTKPRSAPPAWNCCCR